MLENHQLNHVQKYRRTQESVGTQAPKKKVDKKGPFFDKKDEYDMICW